jgi:hypothetical protein
MASKKNWIQDAVKKPGALRKATGVKQGQTIPVATLKKLAKGNTKNSQRARLALTLRKMK